LLEIYGSEEVIQKEFLTVSAARTGIKTAFRRVSVISALVVGLIWARENIAEGEWDKAAAKLAASGGVAWAFNKLLYARDLPAKDIIARKAGNFGKWFQGAARTNKFVNFLTQRVGTALFLWDVKNLFMSGGYGGPNIPFDIVYIVDIADPATWTPPNQTLLDLGFDIWYRQKPTKEHPEETYLGKVEGSKLKAIGRVLGLGREKSPEESHPAQ